MSRSKNKKKRVKMLRRHTELRRKKRLKEEAKKAS